ncbi:cysteine hydrolase family protein [Aeromicrobium sp. Leaf350]|uniref:cysteine hydrolase family protein n=1 Tax=Aeromicrobium sp. Leaf350 TaxID=2876565 RepID=UPI001E5822CD|nr:isochorismatase family cysteine hydrolase [Aeromicrobium sp. Leaf350]
MDLNASTTAFIACHFEYDIVGPDGAFAPFFREQIEQRGVLSVAKRLVEGARAKDVRVVYTRVAFQAGHIDLVTNIPLLGAVGQQGSLLDGSHGGDIVDEVKPGGDDWVVTNPKVSGFASSDLDARLREAGIDTVVLFGVATNLSVESTGRSAGDLGYRVVVVSDACSAASDAAHDATLETFGLLGEVATADDVLAAL